jgi:tetratricopeptide (TPR) repeat protein
MKKYLLRKFLFLLLIVLAVPSLWAQSAQYYLGRGEIYLSQNDYDSAIREFTEAISLNPDYDAYSLRGSAYLEKGNYAAAISDYTQAIRLSPDPFLASSAHYNRAVSYYYNSNYDAAIDDFTQAMVYGNTHWSDYNWRGNAYYYDRAIVDYNQAILLLGDYGFLYQARGNAYWAKGDYAAANSDFATARELGYR